MEQEESKASKLFGNNNKEEKISKRGYSEGIRIKKQEDFIASPEQPTLNHLKDGFIRLILQIIIGITFYTTATAHNPSGEGLAYQKQFDKILKSNQPDTTKLQFILDNLNNLSVRASNLPIQYAQKGIALAKQKDLPKWQGELTVELGWLYQSLNQVKTSEETYQTAINIFETANLLKQQARAHGKLSLLYGQTRNADRALQQARQAIAIAEKLEDELSLAYAYYAISYNFINARKVTEALEYIDKSIQIYQKHGQIYRIAVLMENKITGYLQLGNPQAALKAANELMQTIPQDNPTANKTTNNHYLGKALYNRAKAYMQLNQYNQALTDNEALQVLISDNGTSLVDAAYIFQKAKILHAQEAYKLSQALCLTLLQHPTVKAERFLGYTYELLSKNCEALNQYKSAYKYHLAFEKYEALETVNTANLKMEELQAKYEAEKNAATIATQKQRLSQQRIQQWLALGFTGILGLLFFQTYRNAKTRKVSNEALRMSNQQLGESNQLLAEKNKENEVLIKEIHHRVKNNLEIVSSLLELQAAQLPDSITQSILMDSQNRVQSMGIIHQKLYQKGNLKSVEMLDYFKNLKESLLESFNAWDKMQIDLNMEKINLDVEVATPIGLIVNELITNAWKYAFPVALFQDKKGIIRIHLTQKENQQLQLVVADNGVGKQANDPIKGTGFGSQLIYLLTKQLNGNLKEEVENGTTFTFDFQLSNK